MRKTRWQKHIIGVYHCAYPYLGWCDGDPQMIDYSKGFCLGLPPIVYFPTCATKRNQVYVYKCSAKSTMDGMSWLGSARRRWKVSTVASITWGSSQLRAKGSCHSMIAAGLSCIRILEAVKKSLQTFPSASVPLGDVGANKMGLNKCLFPKWVRALQGLRTFFFHLRKRWVNGGHVSQWFPSGILLGMGSVLMGSSSMRPWVPYNQGSRVAGFIASCSMLDAQSAKNVGVGCCQTSMVPCWRSWPTPMDHRSSGVNPRHLRLRPSAFQRRSCGPRRITAWQNMCCVNNKLTWCCTA